MHQPFWPVTRAVQPLAPLNPFCGPQTSSCHVVDGGAPLPLGQPDGNQNQHEPTGLVGAGGTIGAAGGGLIGGVGGGGEGVGKSGGGGGGRIGGESG